MSIELFKYNNSAWTTKNNKLKHKTTLKKFLSKNNKILKWLTPLKNSTCILISFEASMVSSILFSIRFRETLHHSTKRHPPGHQQTRHHCTNPVRNWKNSNFLHRNTSTYWPKFSTVPSYHHSPNQRTSIAKPQKYLLLEWIPQS